jgi:Kef-type K+ transport system membrane component KefB
MPGLIGLIFLGMLVGPFVLGWIPLDGLVSDLGDIGLLYLMFLAGLSFNTRAFMENRSNAIAPARVVSDAGAYTQWRTAKALRKVSVMVLA